MHFLTGKATFRTTAAAAKNQGVSAVYVAEKSRARRECSEKGIFMMED
jgi:hypothetical protein